MYNVNMRDNNSLNLKQYWSDLATILSHMKRFQEAINKFRIKYKIKPTGIPRDQRADWYSSFFLKPTFDARKKFGGLSDYELLPPNKGFVKDIEKLASDFNLDSRWYIPLFLLISSGGYNITPPFEASVNPLPRFNDVRLPEKQQVITRLLIEIRKDTSLGDIRKAWGQIKKYQKKMISDTPQKRKQIKSETIKRYIQIREMEDMGVPQKEIAQQLGFLATEDVSRFKSSEIENRFKKIAPPTMP